jgi:outer membrane receptor for ferrienterochelin and colicins
MNFWGYIVDDSENGAGGAQALDPVGRENNETFQVDASYDRDDLVPDWEISARLYYRYHHDDTYLVLFPPGAVLPIGSDGNINFVSPVNFVLFTDGAIGNPRYVESQAGVDLTTFYKGLTDHLWRINTGLKNFAADTEEFKNFGPGSGIDPTAPLPAVVSPVSKDDVIEVFSPDIYMEDQDRMLWYVSLQDEWAFARDWELTAGVRYDHYSDFGSTINPRLALVWETRPDLTTKLLYGSAFRPPSFAELYFQNNPAAYGNPDLDPETIDTFELVFDYQPTSNFNIILSSFYYEIENLIEYLPVSASELKAQNARDQKGSGFELEASWQIIKTFQLKGNVAYQDSEDKNTGATVPDAPRWQSYLNGHWDFYPEWSLDAQWFWIADRKRAAGDLRPDIDNYSLVNLSMRRKNIYRHWDFALLAKNVFDADIREPSSISIPDDYPMEGRSVFGELRVHF